MRFSRAIRVSWWGESQLGIVLGVISWGWLRNLIFINLQ